VSEPAQAQSAAAFEPLALVGTTLEERYELTAHLATGGMGAVFRARHVHLRKDVAVKVLRPDLCTSPDLVERFRREAEIASALEHDHIVRVTDFGRSADGYLYLVMELLTGESLFDRLRREGFLQPSEVVQVLWQVCAGLEAAHALGVVHRDLKPENVFLARTSNGREVTKILDFGIAKIAGPASVSSTQAGVVVGTPEYLAPEQAVGGEVDARADLYAVGLIAWRALAGRHPFKADEPRALLMMQATRPVPPLTDPRPDLGMYPALVAAVAKACAKEVGDRYQTAGELRDDFATALGTDFVLPPGATPSPILDLSPIPLPRPSTLLAPPPDRTRSVTPVRTAGAFAPARPVDRLRLALARATRVVRDRADAIRARVEPRLRRGADEVRARPWIAVVAAAAVLVAIVAGAGVAWSQGRAASEARSALAAGQPERALAALDRALARRPDDPELTLLRARALNRIPGSEAAAVAAYSASRAHAPLDPAALDDLARDLALDRSLADRAGRVLVESGDAAIPALARAAKEGPGVQRLRALTLARDLGAEEKLARVEAYGALLEDPDCEIRRAAARRLGEIGDSAALPALRRAATARVETKGLFGITSKATACGAGEAAQATRRIEAASAR
jgi:serine/threonine-protein kinase